MTTSEFSNEFDILYNNIMSNIAPGLNEYEKSVFLTEAQEEIVINLYNGRNAYGLSFEETEEIRRYLESLVKTATLEESTGTGVSEYSEFYNLPSDLWFITYETVKFGSDVTCRANRNALVVPISQDDFWRVSNNPFRRANKRRALRLDCGSNKVEIVSPYSIDKYTIRYMSRPTPIILENLPETLSINGVSTKSECSLNTSLHRLILGRAVEIAKSTIIQNNQ